MSRTYKRPYTKSKHFDRTCRNHGGCPWCARGRMHKNKRREPLVTSENFGTLLLESARQAAAYDEAHPYLT